MFLSLFPRYSLITLNSILFSRDVSILQGHSPDHRLWEGLLKTEQILVCDSYHVSLFRKSQTNYSPFHHCDTPSVSTRKSKHRICFLWGVHDSTEYFSEITFMLNSTDQQIQLHYQGDRIVLDYFGNSRYFQFLWLNHSILSFFKRLILIMLILFDTHEVCLFQIHNF